MSGVNLTLLAEASGLVDGTLQAAGAGPERLHPQLLGPAALDAIAQYQQTGESENTRRGYRQALRYWLAWFNVRYGGDLQLPVHLATVAQFVLDHAETKPGALDHRLPEAHDTRLVAAGVKARSGPLAMATIEHRLAALARAHRDRGLPSPAEDPMVRRLLRNVRVTQRKDGAAPKQKAALDQPTLKRLLATCEPTPLGIRDRALLCFGFSTGGRRRSEIAGADFAFLTSTAEGWQYRVAHSKTNQAATSRPQDLKPVVGDAAAALAAWLDVLEDQGIARSGRIFRKVARGGLIGGPLSDGAVREIVKRRCALAGLDVATFSAHSLRAGFLTEAGRRGVHLKDAMDMSGHASVEVAMGYMRAGQLASQPAARLLDDE